MKLFSGPSLPADLRTPCLLSLQLIVTSSAATTSPLTLPPHTSSRQPASHCHPNYRSGRSLPQNWYEVRCPTTSSTLCQAPSAEPWGDGDSNVTSASCDFLLQSTASCQVRYKQYCMPSCHACCTPYPCHQSCTNRCLPPFCSALHRSQPERLAMPILPLPSRSLVAVGRVLSSLEYF